MYKVMVVDDHFVVRERIKRIKIWGEEIGFYIYDEAENGCEALDKLRVNPVDLVITDILMPKIDGIELLQKIKEKELASYVVFLSDYSEFSYAKEGFKHGVFDYLLKPVREEELRELLVRVKNQIILRQTESEKIKLLEQKLKEKDDLFYPKDHVKQIISYLGSGEKEIEEASENLVNFIAEAFRDDKIKAYGMTEKILKEIWESSQEKYSWLEMFTDRTFYGEEKLCNLFQNDSFIKAALVDLIENIDAVVSRIEPHVDNNTVKQIRKYVIENLEKEISLDTIIQSIHFNKSYISKLFKQKTGMTVEEYIFMVKMERARKLLEEGNYRNFEVAYKLGYKNPGHFSKMFKKYTGLSPIQYKKGM